MIFGPIGFCPRMNTFFRPAALKLKNQHFMPKTAYFQSIFNRTYGSRVEQFGYCRTFSTSQNYKAEFSMNKSAKIGLFVLFGSVLLTSKHVHTELNSIHKKALTDEESLQTHIHTKVLETINYSNEIPGLKFEEFSALKSEICKIWNNLNKEGSIEVSGTDSDFRPYFVALQSVIEYVLASELQKNVKFLMGVIHTPMPATPVCTRGEISKDLVESSLESDPTRIFTVKSRTTIIRDYLYKGGDLFIIYPKNGFFKRTEEQRKIYLQELDNNSDHLFNVPLDCETIPTELIGATYLFQDHSGNKFIFAIKMTQANDPKEIGNFGLWFGSIHHPSIVERLQAVSSYLETNEVSALKP